MALEELEADPSRRVVLARCALCRRRIVELSPHGRVAAVFPPTGSARGFVDASLNDVPDRVVLACPGKRCALRVTVSMSRLVDAFIRCARARVDLIVGEHV